MSARRKLSLFTAAFALAAWATVGSVLADVDFAKEIAPILEHRCVGCHNATDRKGGLDLSTRAGLTAGSETGLVITGTEPDRSLLVTVVSGTKPRMPFRGAPLTDRDVALLREWIRSGAEWPADMVLTASETPGSDAWWSLRELTRPAVPDTAAQPRNPIDAFVDAELAAQGLTPTGPADRRTLIRRLWFDVVGLPPSPETTAAFVAHPGDDDAAWGAAVDELLASPHYGERQARHWLDVVHYGDTHGFDKDKVRPNAWPYRDYVIRAFNADKPYSQFVLEQIAGDVVAPGTMDGVTALGFLAAGPWDFVGQVELREGTIDKQITRNLDRDDFVATTCNTFLGLTVQCARCHDHKFDPVSQTEYYRLQAVFAAIDRADRPFETDASLPEQRRQLEARRGSFAEERRRLNEQAARLVSPELKQIEADLEARLKSDPLPVRPEFGYHSAIETTADRGKWLQLDFGKPVAMEQVLYVACHDDFGGIGAGFGFPVRYKVECSDDPAFVKDVRLLRDETAADVANPGVVPQVIAVKDVSARYLRFTATRLAPRTKDFIFALAEIAVFSPTGENLARTAKVTSLDSIEALPRWTRNNLTDGYFFGGPAPDHWSKLARLTVDRDRLRLSLLPESLRKEIAAIRESEADITMRLAALPKPDLVYAASTDFAQNGSFSATRGAARPIHVLKRGSEKAPGELVQPGVPACVVGMPRELSLPSGASEGDVRAALARWIVDPKNGLTWRVMVNRVWQTHFGKGLVETPSDFGRMGALPTHPALLEWLACEFRDGGKFVKAQSLKSLHRLILTSATWRRAASHVAANVAVDASNRYLWRGPRTRLDAESIRDTVLVVSGKLDPKMYGPAYRPFGFKDDHSPHYLYEQHDPDDPASHRRSIYRFLVRSVPEPFMETLDCADPSQAVPKRNETLTALQALSLLNNPFMVRMAEHFAARVEREAPSPADQLPLAFRLAIGREPTAEETAVLADVREKHGLSQVCRLLFNLNEFAFVD
jgi:hypothetical protein